jgi:prolipoprotein diacylglyceryltransferase
MADGLGLIFGLGILFMIIWLILLAVIAGAIVFWILMIVDVAKRKFSKEDDRTVWILVVVLAGIIGAIIYYFMIKKKDKK